MPASRFNAFTDYGVGIGLRIAHYQHILEKKPVVDWFEIISENYMVDAGRPLAVLDRILEQYRVVQHGVSMYFGNAARPNRDHLKRLKALVKRTGTPWLSDHLCWGSVDGRYTHDLLPMPYTWDAVKWTARNIREVQDFVGIPVAVENVSSYAEFHASEMTEWEFLNEVVERADCGILLDVNNIYVSSKNHGFDPYTYLDAVPAERVAQIHIAGHTKFERYLLDTHDHPVLDPVWKMYAHAVARVGHTATLLEWDDRIPSFNEVHREALKANRFLPMPARSQPSSLADIQRAITGALMVPLGPGERMRASAAEVANRIIKPNDRLSSFERLQIYNQQYWWRIMAAFREDFRGLLAVLGERKFERLAVAYIEACGSTSWNLRDLGQALEPFVRAQPELTSPHTPLAVEMTRVEWARVIAFDGPEQPRLDATKLGGNPERLRLGLQPYVTLLELAYPVDRLLARLRKRSTETGSVSNAVSASVHRRPIRLAAKASPEPIHLAIHRVDLSVYFKRLEPAAYRLLTALREGDTLADACATAFDSKAPANAAEKIQAWFASWMRLGWLVKR